MASWLSLLASFWATYESVAQFVGLNAILGLSVYVTLAAGQLSLGQAAFMGVGAYTAALLTMEAGWPFGLVLAAGIAAAGLSAFLLGLVVLRLRGVYLAIATLGFGAVFGVVLLNLPISGGAEGLRPIPNLTTTWQIYLALAVLAFGLWRMDGSTFGRALFALRDDEAAAASLGIDPFRTNLVAFVVSGMLAGLAGGLSAHLTYIITPGEFGFASALEILVYAIVGGTTTFLGPIVGAALLTVLPEVMRQLPVDPGASELFVSGLVLLAVILFLPAGLASLVVGRVRPASRIREAPIMPQLPPRPAIEPTPPPSPAIAPTPEAEPRPAIAPTPEAEPGPEALTPERPEPGSRPATEPLLLIEGLGRRFGGLRALESVDLRVVQGEVVGLIGPNGAGKTTLVNAITGLLPPSGGRVRFAGQDITGWAAHRVARLGLIRTYQNVRLFRHLTVLDNVLVGTALGRPGTLGPRLVGRSGGQEAAARAEALRLLDRLGIAHLAARPAGGLSYGDRRRLEICRALAARPRLLVLDEPAAGMSAPEADRVGTLVRELAAEGLGVLLIEHNVRLVMATCDRVTVIDFGSRIAEGLPATVARDPRVIDAYLGSPASPA